MVKSLYSFASCTCQKPLFVSSLLNTLTPLNWASVTSTFGMGCTSLMTFSFSSFKSTHIWTHPVGLGTTTIAAHHGVGSFTRDITPMLSIHCNSCFTFSRRGTSTFLRVKREKGCASGLSLMVYSPLKVPYP